MQAQNPMREDIKLREDMRQEMIVCAPQCVVRIPSIEHSNTSTLTAVNEWPTFSPIKYLTQVHYIALVIVL